MGRAERFSKPSQKIGLRSQLSEGAQSRTAVEIMNMNEIVNESDEITKPYTNDGQILDLPAYTIRQQKAIDNTLKTMKTTVKNPPT